MMPTEENGYANYLMTFGLILGSIIGSIIGIFINNLLLGIVAGYALGALVYFLAVNKELKDKE